MEHASLDSPLGRVLALGGLRALYQPVVELETASVVGYEALARGPEGSELQRPDLLFQAARREGRLGEHGGDPCPAHAVRERRAG